MITVPSVILAALTATLLYLLIFRPWPGQVPGVPMVAGERDPAGTSQLLGLTADVPVGVTVFDWEACDCFLCTQPGDAA